MGDQPYRRDGEVDRHAPMVGRSGTGSAVFQRLRSLPYQASAHGQRRRHSQYVGVLRAATLAMLSCTTLIRGLDSHALTRYIGRF